MAATMAIFTTAGAKEFTVIPVSAYSFAVALARLLTAALLAL